ncbi:MAG: T9SS type A sorting domain-containing protein [Bacteroidales bacterium]|nr:T9SS type A sorting domain-containing protein [Bacteroidales bacterium]
MKPKFNLLMLLLCVALQSMAQSVTYAYDANGNRIKREIVVGSNKSITTDDDIDVSPVYDAIGNYDIKIYPNPTHGMLRVDIVTIGDETFSIDVFDMNGRNVYRIANADNVNAIDLTSCENGMYVLVIIKGDEKRTWKIIKR